MNFEVIERVLKEFELILEEKPARGATHFYEAVRVDEMATDEKPEIKTVVTASRDTGGEVTGVTVTMPRKGMSRAAVNKNALLIVGLITTALPEWEGSALWTAQAASQVTAHRRVARSQNRHVMAMDFWGKKKATLRFTLHRQ